MDESMTCSSLDPAWQAPCRQCEEHTEPSKYAYGEMRKASPQVNQWRASEKKPISKSMENFHTSFHPAGVWPHGFLDQACLYKQDMVKSRKRLSANHHPDRIIQRSLEAPLPLMSGAQYPVSQVAGQCDSKHKLFKNISLQFTIWDWIWLFWSINKKCSIFLRKFWSSH